jgi:hypothetical protein
MFSFYVMTPWNPFLAMQLLYATLDMWELLLFMCLSCIDLLNLVQCFGGKFVRCCVDCILVDFSITHIFISDSERIIGTVWSVGV